MKDLCDPLYSWLYRSLTLQAAGIVVGVVLIAAHVAALLRAPALRPALNKVPRSLGIGSVFLTIDFVWAFVVATSMDLGEFQSMRWLAQAALPVMYVAMMFWSNDYLGARSIGMFLLLAACPVLNAAFLQPPQSRLLLALLMYVWVLLGLFWVGMPFTLRDQIAWATAKEGRFRSLCLGGAVYGAVILGCALAFWGGLAASPAH